MQCFVPSVQTKPVINKKGPAKLCPAVCRWRARYPRGICKLFLLHFVMKFGLEFQMMYSQVMNVYIDKVSVIISLVIVSSVSPQSSNRSAKA